MFYIIGLGLSDEKDITVRGLEAIRASTRVYLEAYTSILVIQKERLEDFYGKSLILADRDMVETQSDEILRGAHTQDVALLVLYNFGQTVSLVFFTDTWRPDSFYDRVRENADLGMHTLVLLDIKVKEQTEENLARGRKIYEPPRYMSIPQAVAQLIEIEDTRNEGVLVPDRTLAIALSRVGGGPDNERIVCGTLAQLQEQPPHVFGEPLHSLVIVGRRLHHLEAEYASAFAVDATLWRDVAQKVYGCNFD
ncbi:Diphthine synthase [Russula brevipes]|nr:Diphthine synthase [Russula brevipes]